MKFIQNLAGMSDLTEQVVAMDLLMEAKTTVKTYGIALADAETPEVRKLLRRQLDAAIQTHELILTYVSANQCDQGLQVPDQRNSNKKRPAATNKFQ